MTADHRWARLLSLLLHPLFIPTLAVILLYSIPTYLTFSVPAQIKRLVMLLVFVNTCLAPLMIMLLLKRFGLITNLVLNDRHERMYPTLVSVLFYFFTFYLLKQTNVSVVLSIFMMGATIAVVTGFVVTMFWKISFHMMAMGGFTGFLIALSLLLSADVVWLLIPAIILSGLIGSARLVLNAHTPTQVYTGWLTGIAVMIGVYFWI
jgi:membrane-associated phospholipid phosphatase